jgi:hypothetical protein
MSYEEPHGEYWFCVKHHRVETIDEVDSDERLGPFPDEAAAERALQTVAEREKRYQAEDSAWNGD